MTDPEWMAAIRALVGKDYGRVYGWDPVNVPMARQWAEIMGVDNPRYAEGKLVPPAMLQVWCMEGPTINHYPPGSTTENPYEALKLIEAHGYPSVVAVNSELEFDRYLAPGEKLYYTTRLDAISEEKSTALGTGFFITLSMTFFSQHAAGDEEVGRLLFRVFKFKPAHAAKPAMGTPVGPPKIKRPAPGISDDTRFFWDGAHAGKLMIQRCKACGTLRHPPGPCCPECYSFEWDALEASGRGTVYSFVVMHYPEVPPFDYPNPIGLIELEEGTRLVAQLVGVKPADVHIGMPVQVEFNQVDVGAPDGNDTIALPQFRPVVG
ncbi:MAG: Zn-ribbon domain-containing OB-fold protein [Rhodanobacter sp.]|nr:MAG: Zn-ribbon domain-containing OB-fold protein [Rhodanobacter sp.]TAM12736.1 MAG: Zn-ribbon domain-containing OB-fold protein [Rhodanobacter sp.]TAM37558.1 MAG: Zn-ribbon domain-containing OB-fold protein [Rhodanobacter sp.]